MEITKVRNVLPSVAQFAFDDIVDQRVLGASKHIQMIGQMFEEIAQDCVTQSATSQVMLDRIIQVANFFKATRGEASRAVSNAIDLMTKELPQIQAMPTQQAATMVCQSVQSYSAQAKKDIETVVSYSVELSKHMKKIMVFDYSSTVNSFLAELGKVSQSITVYIPESRTINGGYAFVPTSLMAKMQVHFIPDAAIMFFLRDCDAAFFGAETFYADGTAFNTTGSDIVGLACHEFNVPLYVLTPMIKLDTRPIYGYKRSHVINDLKNKLTVAGFSQNELQQVEFRCPELLAVEAKYITAFITEQGVVPSAAMYAASCSYAKNLTGV